MDVSTNQKNRVDFSPVSTYSAENYNQFLKKIKEKLLTGCKYILTHYELIFKMRWHNALSEKYAFKKRIIKCIKKRT